MDGEIGAQPALLVEQLAQALAVDELHDDRQPTTFAAGVFDRVIDRDDVRMAQLGDGDCLASEPFGHDRVCRQRRFQEFDRDLTSEGQIGR